AVALGPGPRDPDALLRLALALVERAPGRAARNRRAQVLSVWTRALAAGRDLSHGAADHRRVLSLPVHRGRRTPLVRICVPADRLHRDLHVDREEDRGRADRTNAARQGGPVAGVV